MLNEIKSELLVELSDEQQQLVAGGNGGGIQFEDLVYNFFKEKVDTVDSKVYLTSGRDGSYILEETSIANRETWSEALKQFGISV